MKTIRELHREEQREAEWRDREEANAAARRRLVRSLKLYDWFYLLAPVVVFVSMLLLIVWCVWKAIHKYDE